MNKLEFELKLGMLIMKSFADDLSQNDLIEVLANRLDEEKRIRTARHRGPPINAEER